MPVVGGASIFQNCVLETLRMRKRKGQEGNCHGCQRLSGGEEDIRVRGHTRMSHTEQGEQGITHRGIYQRSKYIKVVGAEFLMKKNIINEERTLE